MAYRTSARSNAGNRGDAGAVAVEFAILVPLLVLIVFGIMNFGIVLSQKASLNSAVRSAARYASVNIYDGGSVPHTCSAAIERAKEGTDTLGMTADDVQYQVFRGPTFDDAEAFGPLCTDSSASATPPCDGGDQNDILYVRAEYAADLFIPFPEGSIDTSIDLDSVGAYRCEY